MADGPSVETDIWQYYQAQNPGEVQVLGVDLWNGSLSQLAIFGAQTGATYPLLQDGSQGAGNENLLVPYQTYDNFAVINKQGILRYLASKDYGLGTRYHLNEIRGTVDSLVTTLVSVDDPIDPRRFLVTAAPNPFRDEVTIELSNPAASGLPARVTVHDLAGRVVATIWDSELPRGVSRITWDGRSRGGVAAAPGVYLVLARVGDQRLTRRVVRVE